MRIYENRFRNLDEGDDTYVLTLGDDGRFEYDLTTANYAWSTGSTAGGAGLAAGTSYEVAFSEDEVVIASYALGRRR